ncbi:hypothetical protein [Haloarcula marismortui]|uniref:Twin-arginine translocation signal domain-containing protein n=1 Tax=Haloarcula marismortui (strain ATCC 43049 / DSM 3752 / JCM 8966 / VKM B-1809) TaxID=272569 RepID=A0A4P8K1B7_HALMA|nr:hypothetical protein [Haloarcula marismortui]QCP91855.1 hypothetical protein E6P14_13700 [Haloarcula marismortui ATCC 43049]
MSTDDTRGNESIASTNDPSRRQFLGAAATVATLSVDLPADPQPAIPDDFAAHVATEHVQPALRALTRQDYNRSEAIPKLEDALSQLRKEAETHPNGRRN